MKHLSRREILLSGLLLASLTLAVYAPHVLRGGWYYDDWLLVARLQVGAEDGPWGVLRAATHTTHRPGYWVVLSAFYAVGGQGQAPYLVLCAALAALECWLLYLVLRRLGVGLLGAGAVAALLVPAPIIDTTRLWMAGAPATAAVCLVLLGVLASLRGLQASSRRGIWHCVAVIAYACGILVYEIVAPLVALSILLYAPLTSRRGALTRWAADCAATIAMLLLIARGADERRDPEFGVEYLANRVKGLYSPSQEAFLSLLPFEQVLRGPLGLLLVIAGALGVGIALGRRERSVPDIRLWGIVAGAGIVVAAAGLVMLLPADPYFIPRISGIGNRTAVVSVIGALLLLVALTCLLAVGITTLLRVPKAATPVAAILLVLVLAGMVQTELRQQDAWADSWREAQQVVSGVRSSLGRDIPSGSGIVTFRHTTQLLPADVPVFSAPWDLLGAMRLLYDDPSITANPWLPGYACGATGLHVATSAAQAPQVMKYGDLWFVDVMNRTARRIRTRRACELVARAFTS